MNAHTCYGKAFRYLPRCREAACRRRIVQRSSGRDDEDWGYWWRSSRSDAWILQHAPREGDPCGTVYAVDVEPLMLDHIRKRALDEGLKNAVTVQASGTRPNLPKPAQSQAMTRAPSWGRAKHVRTHLWT